MDITRTESLPPPPGIINSIKAGFDAIATHVTAILFPLLLNLFLWLGPRLRMDALFNSVKATMITFWQSGGVPAEDIDRVVKWYESTTAQVNLFWMLRTLPIGISSLSFPDALLKTPLGVPAIWEVNEVNLFGWMFLITLAGWIGGGLYFRSVAVLAIADNNEGRISAAFAVIQTILLSIVWGILAMMILVPVTLVLAVLAQIMPLLAQIAIIFLSFISVWLIVPLYFWSHGIFIKKQNALLSMWSSIQLTRFTLPTSSMFVLTVFLLAFGLNFLWRIPPEDSWMTLVGILGHSFVTTALLASSFIYYRDANTWIQALIEKMRSKVNG
jgi:hypothetical protein